MCKFGNKVKAESVLKSANLFWLSCNLNYLFSQVFKKGFLKYTMIHLSSMYLTAFASVLRSRRFWVWEIGGAIIYAVPAVIRLATGSVVLPVLSLVATPWIGHFIPGNLVEKILVNAFFPGGAGAIGGEIFFANMHGPAATRKEKYKARLIGALLATSAWSLFQLWGNMQNVAGSWGGNLFEYPYVYPLNFLLASLSIFTPDAVGFLKNKATIVYHCLRV
jgi:hypothetical protein